ncbi:GldG family protein [Pendulispora albinea]|uniref:GldG family protein n=1 Tax=Pendulispora albinea TaxID=2741071 RepID=A0ABZ2LR62_9BACT
MNRRPGRRLFGLDAERSLQLAGIVAAVVLAVVVNVLAARHFRRWDWTTGKLYTLSPATLATVRGLQEPVQIWVLLGGGDPLEQSIKQLLVSYTAETNKLDVHYVDPDRDFVALQDVRKRFNIDVDHTAQGRIVTDAIMVVARGDRHWFLLPSDMFEVAGEDTHAKPREEQAITGAIRHVLGGERLKVCFTQGHGELALDRVSADGLGVLRDILEKNNYEPVSVDTTEPNAHEPFNGCALAIIAHPLGPFTREEEARLRTYLLQGGNLLAAIGPINGNGESGMSPPGIADALAPFGVALDEDWVFEMDARLAIPQRMNAQFVVKPKEHPITAGLGPAADGTPGLPRVVVHMARSLHRVDKPDAVPVDLLVTSDASFGMRNIAGAADWKDVPEKRPQDPGGPLAIAMASERPKVAPHAVHGPRVVVIGSGGVMLQANWREERASRGAAILVENAIAWLAAKPEIVDVPSKAEVAAGIKISDGDRVEVRNYVLFFLPGAVAFLGIAVAIARRATERRPRRDGGARRSPGAGAGRSPDAGDAGDASGTEDAAPKSEGS